MENGELTKNKSIKMGFYCGNNLSSNKRIVAEYKKDIRLFHAAGSVCVIQQTHKLIDF